MLSKKDFLDAPLNKSKNRINGKSYGHNPALKTFRHRKYANKILIKEDIENVLFKFK